MPRPYNLTTLDIGPYRIRRVVVWQGIYDLKKSTPRRRLTRAEVTRDGQYVFAWSRWGDAVKWCKAQLAKEGDS